MLVQYTIEESGLVTSLINILKIISQKRKKDFSDKFLFCISVISVLFCITDKIKLGNLPIFTILKVISSNRYILYIIQADIGLHTVVLIQMLV